MALLRSSGSITSSTSVLFVLFVSSTFAVTTCPNRVLAEKGTDVNITCTTNKSTVDLYWYKGKAKEQDLVGKLENGSVSTSQQYRDSYDIGPFGSLKIRNAGLSHESLYTLLTFDSGGTPEEDEVILNITMSPNPPCPIISDCTPCTKCYFNNSVGSGTLTCKVKWVRPLIHLSWKATLQNGVGFFERQPVEMENRSAESWYISVPLDYIMIKPCGAKVILHCMAEGAEQVLQSTVSTVEINSRPCEFSQTTDNPADYNITLAATSAKNSLITIVFVVLVFVVLILIVGVLIMCCVFCHKHRGEALRDGINTNQRRKSDSQDLSMSSPYFMYAEGGHKTTDASGNTQTSFYRGYVVATGDHRGVTPSRFQALDNDRQYFRSDELKTNVLPVC